MYRWNVGRDCQTGFVRCLAVTIIVGYAKVFAKCVFTPEIDRSQWNHNSKTCRILTNLNLQNLFCWWNQVRSGLLVQGQCLANNVIIVGGNYIMCLTLSVVVLYGQWVFRHACFSEIGWQASLKSEIGLMIRRTSI